MLQFLSLLCSVLLPGFLLSFAVFRFLPVPRLVGYVLVVLIFVAAVYLLIVFFSDQVRGGLGLVIFFSLFSIPIGEMAATKAKRDSCQRRSAD